MPLPERFAELDRQMTARLERAVEELRASLRGRLESAQRDWLTTLDDLKPQPTASLISADELAPFEADARAEGRRAAFAELHAASAAMDRAKTQAEILLALLSATRGFASRAALLLTNESEIVVWRSTGFGSTLGHDPLEGARLGWNDEAALGELARGVGSVTVSPAAARTLAARLSTDASGSGVLVPLVLRDHVAAALYAERGDGGPETSALQLLVLAAGQALELLELRGRATTPTLRFAEEVDPAQTGLPRWVPIPTEPELPVLAGAPQATRATPLVEEDPTGVSFLAEPEMAEPPVESMPTRVPEAAFESAVEDLEWEAVEEPLEPAPPAPLLSGAMPEIEPPSAAIERSTWSGAAFEPEPVFEPVEDIWAPPAATGAEPLLETRAFDLGAVAPPPPLETTAPIPTFDEAASTQPPPPARTTNEYPSLELIEPSFELPALPYPTPPAEVADLWNAPLGPQADETIAVPHAPAAGAPAPALPPPSMRPTVQLPMPGAPPPAPAFDTSEDATVMVQRSRVAPPPAPSSPSFQDEAEATMSKRTTEVVPPPDVQGPGWAFRNAPAPRPTGESALHEEARRLARLLVSEIKLYNEEQVEEGRRNRDLYHRLKEDIDRSRQIYEERVHESVRSTTDYFQQELIRSLAGGDPRALGL